MPPRLRQPNLPFREFQDLVTILLPRLREWEFRVRWQDPETIRSMQLRVWHVQGLQDQALLDQVHDQKVEHLDQEPDLPVQAVLVQDLVEQSQD